MSFTESHYHAYYSTVNDHMFIEIISVNIIYIYVISISSYYSLISHYIHWLVVWHMFFHSVGNVIIPTDELIFFQRGGLNHQPDIAMPKQIEQLDGKI